MKKIKFSGSCLLFIIIVSLFSIDLKSQNSEIENSILWEISGNGLETPSYLFGTIHLIPEKEYVFSETAQKCFESCKTLVLETDINLSLKKQLEIAKQLILPEGKKVKDYLNEEQYQHFTSYFLDSVKISKSTFKKMQKIKPIFASALVLNEFIQKPVAYEQKLSKEAEKIGMKAEFLESIDFQLSVINKISIEKQIDMMYVKGLEGNPMTEYNQLLEAYKEQNLEKLGELFEQEEDIENFEQDFLISRNTNWIPLIVDFSKNGSCFFAVGAGHLVGDKGVIQLLRNQGFIVSPLK